MNHIYRLKTNRHTQQLQPVPETARSAGKGRAGTGAQTLAQAAAGTVATAVASVVLAGVANLAHAQQAPPTAPAVKQLPQGGVVSRGSANIVTNTAAAQLTVNQTSARAVIDWASFNVGSQAKVQFNQPDASAVVLNQVQGNNASQIYGQISANGQVILANPNGIFFSPTASVDVGGLVATTGKANADEFMAGKAIFNRDGSTGSVVNQGQLKAALGGYIALLAPEVRNQGVVIAQAGTVALATGEAITLSFNNGGTSLAGLTTTPQAIAALVENRSAVLAEGGQIILSAHALASLQGAVVKNSGQLSATSLTDKGGKIVLMADQIALSSTSRIDANGPQGGGTVLVGGDWQGSGDTRQSKQVTMAQGASIEANATQQGDGGKVVLWSDVNNASSLTQVDGRIEAKGAGTGSGGQVETSGHTLQVGDLSVNAQGRQGQEGQWLLDPYNITITSTADANTALSSNTFTASASGGVVNVTTLQNALVNNDVTVSTTGAGMDAGNITVSAAISWTSANKLTLNANGGVTGSGGITTGASGSNLTINQGGASTYSGIISGSGSLTKLGAGTLTLSGSNTYTGGTLISGGILKLGNAAALGTGTTGDVSVASGAALDLGGQTIQSANAKALTISGTGVSSGGAVLNSSAITATYPGLLTLGADASIIAGSGSIILSNTGTITGSGFNLTLGGASSSSRIASIIGTGTGAVVKQGTGMWVLAGANTYSGNVTISGGTLRLGNAAALGVGTASSITVASGGALDLYGYSVAAANAKPLTLSGTGVSNGGALTNNASSTTAIYPGLLTLAADASVVAGFRGSIVLSNPGTITGAGRNLTLGGSNVTNNAIASIIGTGTGAVIVNSDTTGTWLLSGANTYSGGTTVTTGILKAGSPTAFGTGAIVVNSVAGFGGMVDLNGQTMSSTAGLTISGTGPYAVTGALTNSSTTAATYPGLLTLSAAASIQANTGSIILSNTGTITGAGFNLTLDYGSAAGSRIDSIIGTGPGSVTKTRRGTWILNGANTYTGGTTVSYGTLKVGNPSALGITGAIVVASGGELDLNGQTLTGNQALSIAGFGDKSGGALSNSSVNQATFDGQITLTNSAGITGNIHLTNSNAISGAYSLMLAGNSGGTVSSPISTSVITKQGAGTWTVDVPATTTSINIFAGTLAAGVDQAFSGSIYMAPLGNIPVTLSLGAYSIAPNDVTIQAYGGSITSTTGVLSSAVSVYTDGSKFGSTISAILGGTGMLYLGMTNSPPSTLVLTRANTYTGSTTINNGTLVLGDGGTTGSLSASTAVSIAVGSKLAYNLSTGASPTNAFNNLGTIANVAYGSVLNLSGASFSNNGKLSPSVNETLATPTVASIVLPANPSLNGRTFNVITTGYQSSFAAQTAISWAGTSTGSPTLQLNGLTTVSGQAALGGTLTLSSSQLTIGGGGAIWAFTNNGITRYISSASDATATALSGTALIVVPAGVSATESGALTGAVALPITGGGTLTLSGDNSGYSGAKTLSAGVLKAGSATALGTGTTTVSAGAALDLNGQALTTAGALTLNGMGINGGGALMNSGGSASYAGAVTLGSDSLISGDSGAVALTNTGSLTGGIHVLSLGGAVGGTVSGVVDASFYGLTKEGSGTWTLNGTNTYSTATTVYAGVLKAGSARAFGATGAITVASGAALDLNGQTMTSTGALTLNGTGVGNGGALMNSSATAARYAGSVTLGSDSLIVGGSGTVALSSTGNLTGGNYALTLGGAAGGSVTSVLGLTLLSLTKQDAGTWTLSGANSAYVGGITVNGGTLAAGVATSAYGASSNNILVNGGTLALGTFSQTVGDVTIGANGGDITSSTGVLTGTSYTINNAGSTTATVSAILAGTVPLTKTGTGLATLSGANTYVGDTRINGGTLALGAAGALSTVGTIGFGGGTLQYSASNTTDYSARISTVPGQAYVVDTNGQNVSWASNLASTSASLTKSGTGTLTLGGSNNLSGGVNVNVGTLQASATNALGSGTVAVASGATLAYNVASTVVPSNTFTGAGTIANVAYGQSLDLSGATLSGFTGTYQVAVNESVSPNTVASMVLPTGLNLASNTLSVNTVGVDNNFADTPVITWTSVNGTPTLKLNGTTVSGGQAQNSRTLDLTSSSLILRSAPIIWTMTIGNTTYSFRSTTDSLGASLTADTTINVPAGVSVTESGVLSNTGKLTITGGGSILLSGANTYSGGTFINASTLRIGSDANLGAVPASPATNITINGGTLQGTNAAAHVTLNANRLISVGSAGATFNSTDTFYSMAVNGAISGTGPVTFTSAKDLTVGSIVLSNNSPILLKAAGNITQNASSTVSTVGGSITYWADSDASGDGGIVVTAGTSGANTSISSDGANIVMGGGNGANAAAGYARGGAKGINLGAYTHVHAGTGNVTLQGMVNSNGGSGVGISGMVSGADVTITGRGYDNASGGTTGLYLTGATITASNQANITGVGGATLSTATSNMSNRGISMSTAIIEATGNGNVLVTATGGGYLPGTSNNGLEMAGGSTDNAIRSVNGTVTINATAGPSLTTGISHAVKTTLSPAAQPGNVIFGGPSQVGAITVNADSWSLDSFTAGKFTQVQSSGPVTFKSQSASFSSGGLDLSYVAFANTLTGLTVGQAGNTSSVSMGSAFSANAGVSGYNMAGPISIYGNVYISRPLVSTGTGSNGRITLGGQVIAYTGGNVVGTELLLAGTGSSQVQLVQPGNAVGTLAGSGLGQLFLGNTTALTVGTLGSTQGLTSNSTIDLYTTQGDLTLSNNVTTSNASSGAVKLTAGKNAAVGDTTSGNLVLSGGTVSVGTGGRAMLYTGAVNNPDLTTLVGSGSGHFRYGSTSTVTNYTNLILTGGLYAIYRERPTVSWSSSTDQTIVYGTTPVAPVADAQVGFVNGDQADPVMALVVASTNAPAALNRAGGYYNVGNYVYKRTALAQALGYLASNPRLTVTAATLNVTANDYTKDYNGLAYTGGNGVVYSGFLAGDSVANSLTGTLVYGGNAQSAVNAGSYSITPTGLTSNNYSLNLVSGTLTVKPVPLTITIYDAARLVGESDTPGYKGASYGVFVNKESPAVLGGSLSITRAGGDAAPGFYKGVLQGSGLTSTNYDIKYVSGNYTIVPADQLLVELTNTSSIYAGTPTYGVTSARYYQSSTRSVVDLTSNVVLNGSSLALNDGAGGNTAFTVGALSPLLSSAGKVSVGAYQLGATSITNTSANYSNTITVTGGLEIKQKDVSTSVTGSVSKAYDGTTVMNGLTLAVAGTVAGDAVTAAGNAAYAAKDAGSGLTYNVNNITLSGADARNYVLTDSVSHLGSNTLTGNNGVITPVALSITANNASKIYDGTAWSGGNGVTYAGFVGNEDATVLGGALAYGGTSQGATNAGTYSIIPSGLTSTNYTIGYTNGNLVINPAGLTAITGEVVAPSGAAISKVYDGNTTATLAPANYSIVGWAVGEGATVTKTTGTYDSPDAGTGKTVTVSLLPSDYVATGSTILSNYTLPTSVSGAVGVITPKPVTVTNTARSSIYDGLTTYGTLASNAVKSFTTSALVGSDSVDTVTQTALNVNASSVAQAGGFDMRASSAVMGVGNSANYAFSYGDATHTVAQRPITVTADNKSRVYGDANPTSGSVSLTGGTLANGETLGTATLSSTATSTTAAGQTAALTPTNQTFTAGAAGNYAITYADGTLSITQRPITVTADAKSRVYGDANPALTYTVAADGVGTSRGLVGSETLTGALATTATATTNVGQVAITQGTVTNTNNGNYDITYAGDNLTINARPVTVTADAKSRVYGDANPALTYTVAADGVGTSRGLVGSETLTGALATTATATTNVGQVAITQGTLTNTNNGNYDITYAGDNLTINARPVTVTADAKSRVYGDANPVLTYTVAADGVGMSRGLVGSETLTGALATTATATTNVGQVAIMQGTVTNTNNGNYDITYAGNTLTINARPVTVTADAKSRVYGDANPALTYTVAADGVGTSRGLVGSETLTGALATTATATTNVGQVAITQGTLTNTNNGNYDITYAGNNLTVTPRSVGLTINGALQGTVSKTYDGTTAATLTPDNYLLTGWVGLDGATVTQTSGVYDTPTAGSGKTVTVTLSNSDYSASSGTNLSNYNLPTSITGAVGQISKASATVTANGGTLTYNGANQTVSGFTATGLVNNEAPSVLIGVTASTTYKNAGTYATTASGTDSNYNLTFAPGSMMINKAPLTVTGNSAQVTYNGASQSVSGYTVSGLLGSDTVGSLTSISATGATGKNAGSYTNTVTAGTEANYNVSTVNGNLDIAKANATVTANSGTLTYNGANQTVSGFTASGLVGGETASVLTGVTASTTQKNAGTYATTASGSDGNYNLSFVPGSMVINKAALTVQANNDAKFVTQADASGYAGVSYSGWVGGETALTAGLGGTLAVVRSASGPDGNTSASNALAGSYTGALTASGLTSGNYAISYLPGNYTVVPANQLMVRMAPVSANYGSAASYTVAEAKYLNQNSNTIVDLTGNVSRSGNSFTVSDGAGGSASFTVSPVGAVTSGAGQLAAGSYQLGANGTHVLSNNFSNTLTLVGTQSVTAVPVTPTPQVSKVYDGTTAIAQQAVPVSGVIAGDAVGAAGSGAFASKNAGSNLAYTLTGVSLSGADAANYHLSSSAVSGNNGNITPASLAVSFAAANKVYDGSATVSLTSTDNRIANDVLTVLATGTFADKNVGTSKAVTVSGVSLSGPDAGNYSISSTGASPTANITRLSQVAWVGGASGNWFDPANWAGGAVPDLANVASVTIPAGVTVNFGTTVVAPAQAGTVSLDTLGTAGSLSMSGGTLNVGSGGMTLSNLTQTGGSLSSSGAVALGSLSQTAGSLSAGSLSTTTAYSQTGTGTISVSGPAVISATSGPVVLGNLSTTGSLSVNSTGGAIAQAVGTALSVAGTSVLTASANDLPADVQLSNAGNVLAGAVTATGRNVGLNVSGSLSATVTASEDANLSSTGNMTASTTARNLTTTSGGSTSLGATTLSGNLSVSSVGTVSQTQPLHVAGRSSVVSMQGDVLLNNADNRFGEPVVATGVHTELAGHNATAQRDDAPPVLTPAGVLTASDYSLVVIKMPQEGDGVLHLELRQLINDQKIALPASVQTWLSEALAAGDVQLQGPNGEPLQGITLSNDGAVLEIKAMSERPLPAQILIKAQRSHLLLRVVQASLSN